MTSPEEPRDLAAMVAGHAAGMEVWQSAELHVIECTLRERLAVLGVEPSEQVGVALMATAQLLAERAPEWGGDARGTLAEVAVLGLRLLEGGEAERARDRQ